MRLFAVLVLSLAFAEMSAQTDPGQIQKTPISSGMAQHLEADTSVSFTMVPRAFAADAFEISLGSDGKGSYRLLREPEAVREIHVSTAVWATVESGWNAANSHRCETKLKNIAKTGKKTITFVLGPSAPVTCDFDYSDDSDLNAAATAFQSIAETIRMGEKMKHSLRYDRLGLDEEMDSLVDEVKTGNAIEVQNIAPVLQALIDDDRVMERVKRKAAHLLEGVGIPVKTS